MITNAQIACDSNHLQTKTDYLTYNKLTNIARVIQ